MSKSSEFADELKQNFGDQYELTCGGKVITVKKNDTQCKIEVRIMNPNRFEIWVQDHFDRRVSPEKAYDGVAVATAVEAAFAVFADKSAKIGVNEGIVNYLTLNLEGTGLTIVNKSVLALRAAYVIRGPKKSESYILEARYDERFALMRKSFKNDEDQAKPEKFDLADPDVDAKIVGKLKEWANVSSS
jgi:hypothetical protein